MRPPDHPRSEADLARFPLKCEPRKVFDPATVRAVVRRQVARRGVRS